MKQAGMVVLAIALAVAAWWWYTTEMPRRARERAAAAEVAVAQAERANSLYKWRDAAGNLQITEQPPAGRAYERISREPQDGIQVKGGRD